MTPDIDLRKLLPAGAQAKILANVVHWWGEPNHDANQPGVGYDSADPWTINRQLELMQAVGIDGMVATYYGTRPNQAHKWAGITEMAFQAQKRGMSFVLQADVGLIKFRPDKSVSPNDEFLAQVQAAVKLLALDNYIRDDTGKPYLLEFNLTGGGVDIAAATAKLPSLSLLSKHTGFTWHETGLTSTLRTEYSKNPPPIFGCVYRQFDDRKLSAPDESVWGGAWRYSDPRKGDLWLDCFAATPPGMKWLQLVTWNDYEEGTAMEGILSALTGRRIF